MQKVEHVKVSRLWQPVNWKRLLITALTAIVGTVIAFQALTGYLAIYLFGGGAKVWADLFWLQCQMAGLAQDQCGADGPMRLGFIIGMGLVFSIGSIPAIFILRSAVGLDEKTDGE